VFSRFGTRRRPQGNITFRTFPAGSESYRLELRPGT